MKYRESAGLDDYYEGAKDCGVKPMALCDMDLEYKKVCDAVSRAKEHLAVASTSNDDNAERFCCEYLNKHKCKSLFDVIRRDKEKFLVLRVLRTIFYPDLGVTPDKEVEVYRRILDGKIFLRPDGEDCGKWGEGIVKVGEADGYVLWSDRY